MAKLKQIPSSVIKHDGVISDEFTIIGTAHIQ